MRNFFAKWNRPWVRTTFKVTWITLKWTIISAFLAGIVGGSAAFGYVSALVKKDPVRTEESIRQQMQENAVTGFAYFNDDTVIGQLRTEEDRRLAQLDDIPQLLLDAVLAIEDKDFYNHRGIDFRGLYRAVTQKLLNEEVQTGGSTITQQLARRVFLTLDKDDGRKARELLLALRMERLMSKDEILLAYLNKIPYGNGATGYNLYGIKAAAKGLFNIDDLDKLNVAQAAYLAGLPQSPSQYSAFTSKPEFDEDGFKKAVTREQLVLKRMLEEKKITNEQYQEALKFDLKASMPAAAQKAYTTYPYLMIETEQEAAEILLKIQKPDLDPKKNQAAYNEALKGIHTQLLRGGYQIYTTIDKTIYDSMHEISSNEKNFAPTDDKKGMEQVGAIMIDSKTGAIKGMIEGRNFFEEQLNHATQAFRQPGSTMKPIAAYIPALEKGAIQPASVVDDIPIILKDGVKGFHLPENWDHKFHGLMTARKALNQSYNIPAIDIFLNKVGINDAWDFAKKLGITSIQKEDYVAQTGVIGGLSKGTSVRELTGAYASIPNKGVFNDTFMIREIKDSNGKTIYTHDLKPTPVYSPQSAYLITDMMKTVISQGTATDLMQKYKSYGKIEISGKTGSTQDDADAWFMGFSPDITVGVWIGYDQPINKLSSSLKSSQMHQTYHAKDIWALIMNRTIEQKPELFPTKTFAKPEGIVSATVSSLSGKLPSELTTKSDLLVTDLFNKKYVPTDVDNVMVRMKISSYGGLNYMAQDNTPADFVQEKTVIKRQKSISQLLKEIEVAMSKLPEKSRKPIDNYKPTDYDDDAPSEVDPRVDDGKEPAAPTNVITTKSGDTATIAFQASPNPDIVGYRIYRSDNRGKFQLMGGKVVLAGAETKFTDQIPGTSLIGYYVTAVDVAGKESVPSRSSYTDGSSLDSLFVPSVDGNQIPGATNPPSDSNGGIGEPIGTDNGNHGSAKDLPAAPTGIKAKADGAGVVLTWKANASKDKVKQYQVYFSDKEKGTFKKLGSVSDATEFHYYAAAYNGYYKVTAVNDAGESKPSAAIAYNN
ncbi:transglycosylase domain-containing protein [Paenibacillus alginolyticus]|uniref:transglycosylase domain-containing protein n=1 Tax=Paenibacillus alginolyticus TaxID=59839 RepID=UPI000420B5E9|nr:transglycosylase domain-containing protein [Paenibacillus alginolyticus]MCY9668046.1 transglycosylase domain-containing protein [Paenibacillus alginolyticus]